MSTFVNDLYTLFVMGVDRPNHVANDPKDEVTKLRCIKRQKCKTWKLRESDEEKGIK